MDTSQATSSPSPASDALLRSARKPAGARRGASALSELIESMVADIGADAVEKACRSWCDTNVVRTHTMRIDRANLPTWEVKGRQHKLFPLLLALVDAGVNVMLSGDAGSGKTTAAITVAKTLGRDYVVQSFSKGTTKSDVMGYVPPSKPEGLTYSPLRDAMAHGKIYVTDELDSADPGVLCILNSAIANREALFPDGTTITAHEGFGVIAGINTRATGANALYRGRQAMDAATVDRFFFLRWDYDEALEMAIFGGRDREIPPFNIAEGPALNPESWVGFVQKARAGVKKLSLDHVISPRSSEMGVKLLRAGVGTRWLIDGLVLRNLPEEQGAKLLKEIAG